MPRVLLESLHLRRSLRRIKGVATREARAARKANPQAGFQGRRQRGSIRIPRDLPLVRRGSFPGSSPSEHPRQKALFPDGAEEVHHREDLGVVLHQDLGRAGGLDLGGALEVP